MTCEPSGKDLGSNSLHGTHAKLNFNSEHHVMVHNIQHTQLVSTNQTLYLITCSGGSFRDISGGGLFDRNGGRGGRMSAMRWGGGEF